MYFFRIGFLTMLLIICVCYADDREMEADIFKLQSDIEELKSTVKELQNQVSLNIADRYLDKTVSSIQTNNQKEASKLWQNALNHTTIGAAEDLLHKLVTNAYDGKRLNFYPLFEFILKNNATAAFPHLYSEMEFHMHISEGQEIFVLAYYLKNICGLESPLLKKFPKLVVQLVSKPFILKNIHNEGWVIAEPQMPMCQGRTQCYGNPKTEVYINKLTHELTRESIIQNNKSHWRFHLPQNSFNGSQMSWGFHIKNVAEDNFLIVKMRLTSYFLRENTTFETYFAGDLQSQFMPMLVKGHENENMFKIAMRDKYIDKIEYLFGNNWAKKSFGVEIGRRAQYKDDLKGYTWEAVEVEGHEDGAKEDTDSEDEVSMKSKCQF